MMNNRTAASVSQSVKTDETYSGQSAATRHRKINLLVVVAGLGVGGAEVVIQRLIQNINRDRYNVYVCCIKVRGVIGDELAREGVEIHTLSNYGEAKVDYLTFLKLGRLIRARKIDVMHSHTLDALADAAVCRLFMPRVKLVHTFHYGNYPNIKKKYMLLERAASLMVNSLVAVGEVQKRQLIETYHFSPCEIRRVWNGVPAPTHNDGIDFRLSINTGNRVLIGTIATLIEQKGLKDLLKVAKLVKDAGHDVQFVIIGDGYLKHELESLRDSYSLNDNVILTGWLVNASTTALPAFDIFFQPSLWEAMSIAILEAMTAGKAIVATKVGENPHVIEHEKDGMLVAPGDIQGMAATLTKLITDSALRDGLGKAAAMKAKSCFTARHMTQAYEEIYESLI